MRSVTARGFASVTFAWVACSSQAHGQVRLHSNSEEQLTTQLVNELEKARVGHLATLDAHRAYLVDALARERTLLVQRELAERDAMLTVVLSAKSRRQEPAKVLNDQIGEEWREVTGLGSSDIEANLPVASRHAVALEIERSGLRRQRASLIASFEGAGGKGEYCDPEGEGETRFTTNAGLPEAYGLEATCVELAANTGELKRNARLAGSAAALLDPSGKLGGLFGQAQREAAEAEALAKAQDALVKTVAKQVKALDAYYKCELDRVSVADTIRSDAAAVQGALNALANGDSKTVFGTGTFRSLWAVLASRNIDPPCSVSSAAAPEPAAPKPRAVSADEILSAIGGLDRYAAGDAVLAVVRESALDIQGSLLGEALIGLASAPGVEPDSKSAQQAAAALRVFGDLEQLYRARTNRLPDVSGVLVALADVRMRQATAKIEADRLADLQRLSKQRVVALRQRALLLADARSALGGDPDKAVPAALRRYAESVNRGSIPATVLASAMVKGRYLPWVDREKAVVEASYAMLAPAVAQLQAYGKGGITPETIAQFLQALGLGGIAIK
jgi:hypothetical protein